MKNTITTIVLSIFLLSCILAINITAGETYSQQLDKQYSYYEITGNLTEINITINWESPNAIIEIGKYVNDNFTITFYGEQGEVIGSSSGGASGGSIWSYKKPVIKVNETINETEIIEDEVEDVDDIVVYPDEKKSNRNKYIIIGIIIIVAIALWIIFKKSD